MKKLTGEKDIEILEECLKDIKCITNKLELNSMFNTVKVANNLRDKIENLMVNAKE